VITSSPSIGVRRLAMSVSECLCLSVCSSLRSRVSKMACPNFAKFFAHVTCGRGSVLFWRQCNTLCISGLVDDVTFFHNRRDKCDANRAYTQNGSSGAAREAKCDVYDCIVGNFNVFVLAKTGLGVWAHLVRWEEMPLVDSFQSEWMLIPIPLSYSQIPNETDIDLHNELT